MTMHVRQYVGVYGTLKKTMSGLRYKLDQVERLHTTAVTQADILSLLLQDRDFDRRTLVVIGDHSPPTTTVTTDNINHLSRKHDLLMPNEELKPYLSFQIKRTRPANELGRLYANKYSGILYDERAVSIVCFPGDLVAVQTAVLLYEFGHLSVASVE